MSPFWSDGLAISVHHSQDQPHEILWQGQWRPVTTLSRHWRVHTFWWQGKELWRDYWEVAMPGILGVVYQDLVNREWYMERVYA